MAESITLARPYAKAAFATALESKQLDEWSSALATVSAIVGNEKVASLLASPNHTASAKAKHLGEIAGDLQPSFKSFLHVLADNHRLMLLPEIHSLYESLKAQLQHTVDVEVASAFELSAETLTQLKDTLHKKLGAEINISSHVEKSLIGGVVVRAGDTVIDGSIKGRLAKLATAMNS